MTIKDDYSEYGFEKYWNKAEAYLKKRQFDKSRKVVESIIDIKGKDEQSEVFLERIDIEQHRNYELISNQIEITRRYHFDNLEAQPTVGDFESFRSYKIKGWLIIYDTDSTSVLIKDKNGINSLPFNKVRPGVPEKFEKEGETVLDLCGFDYNVDITKGLKIGFRINGDDYWVKTLELHAVPEVLRGEDNWLFLANDLNKSIEQLTGKLLLRAEQKNSWHNYSKKLKNFQRDYNFLYVIASAKEKVKSDEYPHVIKGKTITEQVEAILQNDGVNYLNPIESLTSNDRTFCKTASHWTDLGAYITYKEIMATSNNLNFIQAPKFTDVEVVGDLGSKLAPMETSVCETFQDNPNILIETPFDNKIKTTGGLRIHINNKVGNKKSVVIFGSSTMHEGQLTKYLSYSFSRVVEVNLSGSIIAEIVSYEQPDLVIVLNDERLLSASGDIFKTFNETAAFKKLSQLSKDKKKEILLHLDNNSEETFYINLVKAALFE